MNILITGGGCTEQIDNVRSITNTSTGRTSAFLADFLAEKKCNVTAIMASKAVMPEKCTKIIKYNSFADLKTVLEAECSSNQYDAVIHAAAVSDFTPDTITVDGKEYKAGAFSKVPSGSDLTIKMKKNPKLVDSLKLWAGKSTKVFAFKLTSNASIEERIAAVNKVFSGNKDSSLSPDFVVSNDLGEIQNGLHPFRIFQKDRQIAAEGQNLKDLAEKICSLIK